jgi:hypothetical protein
MANVLIFHSIERKTESPAEAEQYFTFKCRAVIIISGAILYSGSSKK